MKYLVLIGVATMAVFFDGCKKTAQDTTLVGIWELRLEQASMMPTQSYPAGNGNRIQFSQAKEYTFISNGQVVKSGKFDLAHDTTVAANTCLELPGRDFNRIVYDNNYAATKVFFKLTGGTKLTLISGCFAYDAGTVSVYEKLPE